ncbi:uncharacterized protein LOC118429569 isoform X2 [Branchiostoma floridae]|uniref:chitinase n=1 Tax=Branchiostoma floridae TaxID=7739 RepID=A0A9J7M761_BRAFL|nr:uncharacterized protein LOC118429569 isoform X2 [Branchiostoma floridae]
MYSTVVFCLLALSGTLAMPVTDQANSTQAVTENILNATEAQDVTVQPIEVNVTEQVDASQPTTTQSTPLVTDDNVVTNASTATETVVIETTTESPKFTCGGKAAGLYADPDNCYQYYECVEGFSTAFLRLCAPGGPVFDPAKQRCDWPENVPAPCGTKVRNEGSIRARSSLMARSSSTFTCTGKQPGMYADPADCSMYYECVLGHPVYHRPCAPGGTVYDPASLRCMWPHEVSGPCGTLSANLLTDQTSANVPAHDVPVPSTFTCTGKQLGMYADPADCSMYYECVLGHPVYHRPCAPGGTVYDPASLRCMWPYEVSGPCGTLSANLLTDETSANVPAHDVPVPSTFTCTGKQPGMYADPADCSMYYECVLGHPVYHRPCAPGGTVYDPASLRCMWPHEVSGPCGISANLLTDETSANVPAHDVPVPSIFTCTGKQPGMYADPADCSMYYECVLGHPVYHRPCAPGGTVYDPARQECRWPYEVSGPCGTLSENLLTDETSANVPAHDVPVPSTFTCTGKQPGMYADPADCSMYYECVLVHPVYHRPCAPGGTVYDPARQECRWPYEVSGPCRAYTVPVIQTETFSCAGKAPGHYPDPDSCSRYYECTLLSSEPFHRDCPPGGLVFDAGRQYCTWPWSVAGPCGDYGQ